MTRRFVPAVKLLFKPFYNGFEYSSISFDELDWRDLTDNISQVLGFERDMEFANFKLSSVVCNEGFYVVKIENHEGTLYFYLLQPDVFLKRHVTQ